MKILALGLILLGLSGCRSGGDDEGPVGPHSEVEPGGGKPQTDTANGESSGGGSRQNPNGSASAVGACAEWKFDGDDSIKKFKGQGISIVIDCPTIQKASLGLEDLLKRYRDDLIPETLKQLDGQLNRIKALSKVPSKIILSNYAKRAFGSGEWVLPLTSESNRVTYFVNREVAFQPVELSLFANNVFLTTGTWGFSASADIVFAQWQENDWQKARSVLTALRSDILAQSGKVKVISLPLSTNQTNTIANLHFESISGVVQLPYELRQDYLQYFFSTIVPMQDTFQKKIGSVSFKLGLVDVVSYSQMSNMVQSGVEAERLFGPLRVALSTLTSVAAEISKLSETVKTIRFMKTSMSSVSTFHSRIGAVLSIVLVREDLLLSEPVESLSLQKCLAQLTQEASNLPACKAAFVR